jgi:hypothetical protein
MEHPERDIAGRSFISLDPDKFFLDQRPRLFFPERKTPPADIGPIVDADTDFIGTPGAPEGNKLDRWRLIQ